MHRASSTYSIFQEPTLIMSQAALFHGLIYCSVSQATLQHIQHKDVFSYYINQHEDVTAWPHIHGLIELGRQHSFTHMHGYQSQDSQVKKYHSLNNSPTQKKKKKPIKKYILFKVGGQSNFVCKADCSIYEYFCNSLMTIHLNVLCTIMVLSKF